MSFLILKSIPSSPGFFFTSVGSQDFTDTASFRHFEERFKAAADKRMDCYFHIHPGENHISNMAVNFQRGLNTLYRDWKFRLPDQLDQPADEVLKAHYDRLEEKFGYQVDIGEWEVLYPVMDQLARRGDFDNAIRILEYAIELYPESDQAHAFLARAYFDTGNPELGRTYLEKALELNPDNQFARRMKQMLEQQ